MPVVEQVVEHRVEALLGRIPRLHQVVVEVDVVDRLDRGIGVGVGGEEGALGLGEEPLRFVEKFDAGDAGHALIGEHQGDDLVGQPDLAEHIEGSVAGIDPDDAEALAIFPPDVVRDRLENFGVVVDSHNYWLLHQYLRVPRGIASSTWLGGFSGVLQLSAV